MNNKHVTDTCRSPFDPSTRRSWPGGGGVANGQHDQHKRHRHTPMHVAHRLLQVDLEDEVGLAAVEAAIWAINPTARRIRTHRCAVDVGQILNLLALACDRWAGPLLSFTVCQ